MNAQLVNIRAHKNIDGEMFQKDFTFIFENGAAVTVGIPKSDFDKSEEEQKVIAGRIALRNVSESFRLTQNNEVNQTVNL